MEKRPFRNHTITIMHMPLKGAHPSLKVST